jgi:Uma2 family endonuclease
LETDDATMLTAGQFREWVDRPENSGKRWELVRGVLNELPQWPPSFHSVHMRVVGVLQEYVIRRGCGSVAFLADGLITSRNPDTVRCPAAMVFLDPPGDDFPPRFTTEVPRLVVELVPSDEPLGRQARRTSDYVQFGVELIWVVDPDERYVVEYRPRRSPRVLDETDELTGNGVLPDFKCRVAELFTPPGSSATPAQS